MEEVGEHPDAALLDLGRARVLSVVDEVAVEVSGDDPLCLRLHPRGDERGQVVRRVTFDREVLEHQPHRVGGGHTFGGKLTAGDILGDKAIAEQRCVSVGGGLDGHSLSLGRLIWTDARAWLAGRVLPVGQGSRVMVWWGARQRGSARTASMPGTAVRPRSGN